MLLPYSVDVPMARVPWANWALIALTSLISLVVDFLPRDHYTHAERERFRECLERRGVDPAVAENEVRDAARDGIEQLALRPLAFEPTQLVTNWLVHAGVGHLIGNMLFLFVFGNAVNAKLGHLSYLVGYCSLGVLESAVWMLFGNGLPALGASGAIMGVIGLFLVFFPRNDVSVYYWVGWGGGTRAGAFDISSYWLVAFYVVGDLIGCIWFGGAGGVGYLAHLSGAAYGFAAGLTLVYFGWVESDADEENLLEAVGLRENPHRQRRAYRRARRSTL